LGGVILKDTSGMSVYAHDVSTMRIEEHAEEIELGWITKGQMIYDGKVTPLLGRNILQLRFSKKNPAKVEIAGASPVAVRVTGMPSKVVMDTDDRTPRVIDKWPWYVQALIGVVIAFCLERIYARMRAPGKPVLGPASSGHD
jgi:hypothetical protein